MLDLRLPGVELANWEVSPPAAAALLQGCDHQHVRSSLLFPAHLHACVLVTGHRMFDPFLRNPAPFLVNISSSSLAAQAALFDACVIIGTKERWASGGGSGGNSSNSGSGNGFGSSGGGGGGPLLQPAQALDSVDFPLAPSALLQGLHADVRGVSAAADGRRAADAARAATAVRAALRGYPACLRGSARLKVRSCSLLLRLLACCSVALAALHGIGSPTSFGLASGTRMLDRR